MKHQEDKSPELPPKSTEEQRQIAKEKLLKANRELTELNQTISRQTFNRKAITQ